MRRRLSLPAEEQIWALRCQGWLLRDIAVASGCSYSAARYAIRRARRRRLPASTPIRRNYRYAPSARPVFANRLLIA